MRETAAERRAAERERQHSEDLAQAGQTGVAFGLGTVTDAARYTRVRGFLGACGLALMVGGLSAAVVFALSDSSYPAAAKVAVPAVSLVAAVLGWLLLRLGSRPRAVDRLSWYSGGVAQLVQNEPEPRVLRWADVVSVTLTFTDDTERYTGLVGCLLRGSTGTKIRAGTGYGQPAVWALAAEADRMLAARFAPALIRAYDAGEPAAAGRWQVDRAGLTHVDGSGEEVLTLWGDIRSVECDAAAQHARRVTIRLNGRRRHVVDLSGVPNGMFIPRLIEYAAGQNGIAVTHPRGVRSGS